MRFPRGYRETVYTDEGVRAFIGSCRAELETMLAATAGDPAAASAREEIAPGLAANLRPVKKSTFVQFCKQVRQATPAQAEMQQKPGAVASPFLPLSGPEGSAALPLPRAI
jgi:hypothetical protein